MRTETINGVELEFLYPTDRCECGLIVAYGELFHRESRAHAQAISALAASNKLPDNYVAVMDDEQRFCYDGLLDHGHNDPFDRGPYVLRFEPGVCTCHPND